MAKINKEQLATEMQKYEFLYDKLHSHHIEEQDNNHRRSQD